MVTKAWGAVYRTTTVCIDSYDNGVLAGRFFNPYLAKGKEFQSVTQFLLEMEEALDVMDFPRAFTTTRTFASSPKGEPVSVDPINKTGKEATFLIRVLFRQNASWQGSITWLEGREEQSFRSVLELLLLMDNALSCPRAS